MEGLSAKITAWPQRLKWPEIQKRRLVLPTNKNVVAILVVLAILVVSRFRRL